MKLFGNSSGKKRQSPPRETQVTFEAVSPEELPETETAYVRSQGSGEYAAPRGKNRFRVGYILYVCLLLAVILAGLTMLWKRLDVYEKSRPYLAVEEWIAGADSAYWHELLSGRGVQESFLRTLDLENAGYYKKLDMYTDAIPAYGVRFGKKTMLTVTLKEGADLGFGENAWTLDDVSLVSSGLLVYAPEDAVITVDGVPVGPECLVQKNAQSVTPGPLEQTRDDLPGLAKYALDSVFDPEGLRVTDAAGDALSPAWSAGNALYYAPITSGYVIHAPSAAAVTVNGIPLTEENAEIQAAPLEDFQGIEDSVPVVPEERTYAIDGLLARPVVAARLADGTALAPAAEDGEGWTFLLPPDEALAEELSDYILDVFDKYIAYLGNRNSDMYGNYARYLACLVPGSEAADRAERALNSITWVRGRDTHPRSVSLREVLRYHESCFTAQVDFSMEEGGEANSYLFIFVRHEGQWRAVRVMNKTSYV